jgi:hypothetical protein
VDPRVEGRVMPPGFTGLSLEYNALPASTSPHDVDRVLVQLLRNLAPGQRPVLRIGGLSTDSTWWPLRGIKPPRGVKYSLSQDWMTDVRALAEVSDARLVLGINLGARSPMIAGSEARALIAGLGRQHVEALELGNEPERYGLRGWYRSLLGEPAIQRGLDSQLAEYEQEFSTLERALPPRIPLVGPSSFDHRWISHLTRFMAGRPMLSTLTIHAYGYGCVRDPRSPRYPTVPRLLQPSASQDGFPPSPPVPALIDDAHRDHMAVRVDEINSVSCEGLNGVSNTFAAALWALDTLFHLAADDVDGVNFHTRSFAENRLFALHRHHGRWTASVSPEYYGIQLFARATPAGARLVPTAGCAEIRCWATLGREGRLRIVLINDSLERPRSVLVRVRGTAGPAVVQRLEAASAYATGGVTLAGQSYGSSTTTGSLAGSLRESSVAQSHGVYRVVLPATSAAMLTIPIG